MTPAGMNNEPMTETGAKHEHADILSILLAGRQPGNLATGVRQRRRWPGIEASTVRRGHARGRCRAYALSLDQLLALVCARGTHKWRR